MKLIAIHKAKEVKSLKCYKRKYLTFYRDCDTHVIRGVARIQKKYLKISRRFLILMIYTETNITKTKKLEFHRNH